MATPAGIPKLDTKIILFCPFRSPHGQNAVVSVWINTSTYHILQENLVLFRQLGHRWELLEVASFFLNTNCIFSHRHTIFFFPCMSSCRPRDYLYFILMIVQVTCTKYIYTYIGCNLLGHTCTHLAPTNYLPTCRTLVPASYVRSQRAATWSMAISCQAR
jgi:hypothetical protein